MWAGILYLTPTSPFKQELEYSKEDKQGEFELVDAIGNVYNRLVLYRGDLLHRSLLSDLEIHPKAADLHKFSLMCEEQPQEVGENDN